MRTKTAIAGLIYPQIGVVLIGLGIVTTLMVPPLKTEAMLVLPVLIAAALIAAAPLSWWIAPRLRLRYWRSRQGGRYGGQ